MEVEVATRRLLIALTAVNALAVGVSIVRSSRLAAASEPDTLRARAIELVDQHGQVRAQLNVEPSGEAVFRLRVNLALEVRQPAADSPSELWQRRTSGGRLSVNPSHDDFPAMLAEALDRVAAEEFDLAASAQKLGITGSQLVKFLKIEPRALAKVNHARESQGLAKLR